MQLHAFKICDVVVFCRVDLLLPSIFCLTEVGHITVADFDCVAVKDIVKHIIFRKLFVIDFKERSGPTFVATFLLKGRLNQIMFLWRYLVVEFEDCVMLGVNVSR